MKKYLPFLILVLTVTILFAQSHLNSNQVSVSTFTALLTTTEVTSVVPNPPPDNYSIAVPQNNTCLYNMVFRNGLNQTIHTVTGTPGDYTINAGQIVFDKGFAEAGDLIKVVCFYGKTQ